MQPRKLPIDYTLAFLVVCFSIFSLVGIYSGSGQYASSNPMLFVRRQLVFYVIGFILMMAVAYFDFEVIEKWTWFFYGVGMVLLLAVPLVGVEKNGAQRWLNLGMEIQPSEIMKIFLVIHIAMLLARAGKYRLSFKESVIVTSKILLYSVVPLYLIFAQPDLGTTLMIVFTLFVMMFASSISLKVISILTSIGLAGIGAFAYLYVYQLDFLKSILPSHQVPRILGWLNPAEYSQGIGYQLQQSLLGIGSGQLTGAGFRNGYQVQSGRVPEAHTDFIFAAIGEEFGFIGTSILVILFFLLIYRIITIAFHANSLFGVYICIGVIGLFTFQVFQNIGMTIGLMPITGLALPFISYGGSALLTNMLALGLVTSVHLRTKSYMFGEEETIE
ncbi:rod shape-determining protein RodA [Amphibacillus marinus]|uniref:Rod shape-determining protein RodA n=1 Tax=Amphibacillus marinus TaxID=872970 RepID=A0A1H8QBJ3_9BACI|nr:rod shape-determining protein RodA [Amphibacillus marinus]SEO51582.1 rod shape-determining protein RodA [Amphibacillus marinus]